MNQSVSLLETIAVAVVGGILISLNPYIGGTIIVAYAWARYAWGYR